MKVMVITPRTVKFNAQTSYLCIFLTSKGFEVIVPDCNWKSSDTILAFHEAGDLIVDGIVIVSDNTLVYGKRLQRIIDTCEELRMKGKVSVIWLTGYMTTSLSSWLVYVMQMEFVGFRAEWNKGENWVN